MRSEALFGMIARLYRMAEMETEQLRGGDSAALQAEILLSRPAA